MTPRGCRTRGATPIPQFYDFKILKTSKWELNPYSRQNDAHRIQGGG